MGGGLGRGIDEQVEVALQCFEICRIAHVAMGEFDIQFFEIRQIEFRSPAFEVVEGDNAEFGIVAAVAARPARADESGAAGDA